MSDPVIRVADPSEYAGLVDLALRELPHLERVEFEPILLDDAFTQELTVLVADAGDEVVGFGFLAHYRAQDVDRRGLRVIVTAPHRGRGIGGRLHAALWHEVPPGVRGVRATTYDDDQRTVDIAEHWGYLRVQRSISSRLALDGVTDPDVAADLTVSSHPTFEFPDPEAVEAMLDASQTNPERYSYGVMDLAKLQAMLSSEETPLMLLVRVDGTPAALSYGGAVGELSYVGYTGVDPTYRGRGLARLAKAALHAEARRLGAMVCFTENEEHNAGIRRLNAELGYDVLFGVWRHERKLDL